MSRPKAKPLQRRKPTPVPALPAVATEPYPDIVAEIEAAHAALRDVRRDRRCAEQILDASAETG